MFVNIVSSIRFIGTYLSLMGNPQNHQVIGVDQSKNDMRGTKFTVTVVFRSNKIFSYVSFSLNYIVMLNWNIKGES